MQGKIGFIGTGNMGQAIIKGILTADLVSEKEIIAYDSYHPALEKVKNSLGIQTATSENEVVQQANMIILAVKPTMVADVLTRVKNDVNKEKIIVSIAAGKTIDDLSKCLAEDAKIIRVMPNSPAMIGQGMSALCINDQISQDDQQAVLAIFASFGQAKVVEEYLMDAVTAVSGAGPAYVYLFIEALADGAVALGMSRKDAYVFAAQTVSGAAQMADEKLN
ncbi:pyrroline-5-carboxylate reductase [Fundicoccus culcitae]|uniref:Pyrroline-5-carboxylate reductase n=1 Tax=Fundicoccus culcitae TaxID=2969821 RepID=A0ABY5P8D3_9LACT|nr:pyrroline-5-carboxylate reductase [Fundicoccus culcitae]UUX34784.1 pyrroline-5-carboxylate reductase [Fundicoccus culcitae]